MNRLQSNIRKDFQISENKFLISEKVLRTYQKCIPNSDIGKNYSVIGKSDIENKKIELFPILEIVISTVMNKILFRISKITRPTSDIKISFFPDFQQGD
jgi:hypothetical protein